MTLHARVKAVPRLRMVADDLTGSLDTAAQLTAVCGPLRVGWSSPLDRSLDVINSDTRDCPEHEAVTRTLALNDWLTGTGVAFKKIDSQLRGHVGAELAAVLANMAITRVVLAPAFPAQNRITRSGAQWLSPPDGQTCRQLGLAIASMLAAHGLQSQPAVAGEPCGDGVTVYDAETDADLDAIARAGLACGAGTLWCGSAGLAGALARALAGPGHVARAPAAGTEVVLPSPLLMVFGTARAVTMLQIAEVEHYDPDIRIRLRPKGLESRRVAQRLGAGLACLVTVEVPVDCDEVAATPLIRQAIERSLGTLKAADVRPGTLFVSGGQTLMAAAQLSGTDYLTVDGEFAPGVPVGWWHGGQFDGLRLAAKSGGFGGEDLLHRLTEAAR